MILLRTGAEYFQATIEGKKLFEIRNKDWRAEPRQRVCLKEFENGAYTGRECIVQVKDVFDLANAGLPDFQTFTFEVLRVYRTVN